MLIRGRIHEEQKLFDFCDTELSLHRSGYRNRQRVLKVASFTDPASGEDRFLIYFLDADGTLKSRKCPRKDMAVRVRDDFSRQRFAIEAEDIIDVVFAERPN